VFPYGVPQEDYLPLLVVLREGLSEENLAAVVAELMDDEVAVVEPAGFYKAPQQP